MRVFLLLITLGLGSVYANSSYSQTKMDIKVKNISLEDLFKEIQSKSEYIFFYNDEVLDIDKTVSIHLKKATLFTILEKVFLNTSLDYTINDRQVVVKIRTEVKVKKNLNQKPVQQKFQVSGSVIDKDGMPLPGASILEKGTTNGVTTDFDGNYSIEVSNENSELVISFLGFTTQVIKVSGKSVIIIILEEDAESLEEVIVTAQGIKKSKKALGYGITKVTSEEIENRPEANLAKTLQGKISGVYISTSSGQTGAAPSIRIRGSMSLTGFNGPLYIVNNVPFSGSIRDIDPNDIKSMSILKGLNAAVLYGSEGRNGVILIQTKSGSADLGETKTTASISSTTYMNTVSQLPEYQNKYGQGQEFGFIPSFLSGDGPAFSTLDEVVHPYAGLGSIFPEFAGATVPYTAKPDNVKNLFDTGLSTIYALSISTSKEKVAFNLSAGYTDEKGIIGNNDLKRFNIGIGGNAQVTDDLNISTTLNYSTRKVNRIQSREIFNRIFYLPRNIDLTKLPYQNPLTGESVYYRNDTNPLWTLNNSGVQDDIVRVFGTFNANYQLNDAFNLTYRVGYDSEHLNTFDYSNKGGVGSTIGSEFRTGYLNLDSRKEVVVDQTILLGYNKQLTDDLNLEVQIGVNSKLTKSQRTSSDSQGQLVYNFLRPSNFSTSQSSFYTVDENIAGVFGQFQLGYKNYLYATLSGRNDWGSTVESENQSLFYPGTSVSFIPTSAFDMGGDIVNYLKLRAAYATSSGFPGPYRTRNTLIIDANRFAAADGSLPVTNRFSRIFANPDLKPELHREFEIGIETKLFKNRVTLETSLYKRISEDQIVESPLAPATGYDIQFINLGRVDNKGVEVDLGIDIVKNENFNWNLRNIFTADESLVVETTAAGSDINLIADRWAVEGLPINAIKGDYAVRDSEGNFLINSNGGASRQGEIVNSANIGLVDKVIGDPNPDWRLTTINSLSYKNFTFSAQIEYRHGGEISSRAIEDLLERGVTRDTENREGTFFIPGFLADSGTGELILDPNGNKIPNNIQMGGMRTVFSNYYDNNDLSMWDASVFRLRELSMGYSFKGKEGDKLPFDKVNLTLTGSNLWYVAPNFPKYVNYDPESDGGLGRNNVPNTKRFALGITVTF
ncbi:MAG: SusC/RagA family TonB-linked outer membrane protein [Lutibacter sp.]|uniref:SusC/RagA family TonB-linked outer membrane protein n=1 Tax=Lutibacter sp. TaxID=1925666 RepID=UPI00385B4B80